MYEDDPRNQAPQPAKAFLPQPDALLNPAMLTLAVRNPLALHDEAEASAAEQGMTFDNEDMARGLDDVRRTAVEEVLAPEARSQLAIGIKGKMVEVVESNAPPALNRVKGLNQGGDAERGVQNLRALHEALPEASRLVRSLIEAQESGRPGETDKIRIVIQRLRNFG